LIGSYVYDFALVMGVITDEFRDVTSSVRFELELLFCELFGICNSSIMIYIGREKYVYIGRIYSCYVVWIKIMKKK